MVPGKKELAVPLARAQVEAAARLYHDHCRDWRAADEALKSLALAFPAFDLRACVLKVAALNALYGTQIYDVVSVARHVHGVLRDGEEPTEVHLFDRLATVPHVKRRLSSFAAKFAHFFIDSERFPIYDAYALRMVTYHLEGRPQAEVPYHAFVAAFIRLKESLDFPVTARELDRYLWLAGEYRAWSGLPPWRQPYRNVNAEARRLFEADACEIRALLAALLGQVGV